MMKTFELSINNIEAHILSLFLLFSIFVLTDTQAQANKFSSPAECERNCKVPCIIARCPKGKEKANPNDGSIDKKENSKTQAKAFIEKYYVKTCKKNNSIPSSWRKECRINIDDKGYVTYTSKYTTPKRTYIDQAWFKLSEINPSKVKYAYISLHSVVLPCTNKVRCIIVQKQSSNNLKKKKFFKFFIPTRTRQQSERLAVAFRTIIKFYKDSF